MNFQPELAQAVMAGRKTVTRRLVSDNPRSPWWKGGCSLKVNGSYAVCPGHLTDDELLVLASAINVTLEIDEAFGKLDATVGLPGYECLSGDRRQALVGLRERLRCVVAEHS